MPRLPTMRVMGSHDISTRSGLAAEGWRTREGVVVGVVTVAMRVSFPIPATVDGLTLSAVMAAVVPAVLAAVMAVAARLVARGQLGAGVAPPGLFAHGVVGDAAQRAHHPAIEAHRGRGDG